VTPIGIIKLKFLKVLIKLLIVIADICYMVLNVFITGFISYRTYSDYIFHGAALVAFPCSCR